MFNFGFGRAGLWGLHDPVAEGFTTFADAHLLFTMFLVDKGTNHWADLFIHFFMERGKRNG